MPTTPTIKPRPSMPAVIYLLIAFCAVVVYVVLVGINLGWWPEGVVIDPSKWEPSVRGAFLIGSAVLFTVCVLAALTDGRMRQRAVVGLEPSRRVATVAYGLLCLGSVFGAYELAGLRIDSFGGLSLGQTQEFLDWALWIVVGFAALFFALVVINARRWQIASSVQKLSSYLPYGVETDSARTAMVTVFAGRRLVRRGTRHRVRVDRNVVGAPPIDIAYLRLFENRARATTFIKSAWREFGTVYLLRSAASVTTAEYRAVRAHGSAAFVSSDAALEERLSVSRSEDPRTGLRRISGVVHKAIWVRDPYGSFAMVPILCHGEYWKNAIDQLLARVQLVVLDLSGFLEGNRGTFYELQRVIDRFPIERVVFICDPRSDFRFLKAHIQRAWSLMDGRSPNSGLLHPVTFIDVTDRFVQVQSSNQAPGQWRLVARRGRTRRLMETVQQSLEAARPWPTGRSMPLCMDCPARTLGAGGQPQHNVM